MTDSSALEDANKPPVQKHFEQLIDDCVPIEIIINDPKFHIVMNPSLPVHQNSPDLFCGFVKPAQQDSTQITDAALLYALDIRNRIVQLLHQYKLRYAGSNSHGGPTGRVQICLNRRWQSIKGITHRNFPLPVRQAPAEQMKPPPEDNTEA